MPFAWVVLQLSVLAVIVLALELGGFTANHLISPRSVYEVLHISKEDISLSLFGLILSPILQQKPVLHWPFQSFVCAFMQIMLVILEILIPLLNNCQKHLHKMMAK